MTRQYARYFLWQNDKCHHIVFRFSYGELDKRSRDRNDKISTRLSEKILQNLFGDEGSN